MRNNINLEPTWLIELKEYFEDDSMLKLKQFLLKEKSEGKIICPQGADIFNAFNLTPFNSVKVVILGQDPYHGEGQAHGLSFSVLEHMNIPPSLKNIFKELQNDISGFQIPKTGNLTSWAKRGVFLLNSILTVRKNEPSSHQNQGWEYFTDKVISILSEKRERLVFLLWGRYARDKKKIIDDSKHLILESAHPSPFSVKNFFGCKHFSKTNDYLQSHSLSKIDWNLS